MKRFQWKWIFTGNKTCCTIWRPFWFAMAAKIQKSSDLGKIWFPSRLWCCELIFIVWEPCYDPSGHISCYNIFYSLLQGTPLKDGVFCLNYNIFYSLLQGRLLKDGVFCVNYVSPSNEGRHIVLVWFFLPLPLPLLPLPLLPLLLVLLSKACPDHNFFVFPDRSMIFGMWVHDHKAVCRVP